MTLARIGNADIYYELIGRGAPLVMIRGLGSNADHWYEQIPALVENYQLLIFDNRGVARSTDPGGAFTIADMAADTVALMDAVGIQRAHIMGLSMGGMIAQEIALNAAEKVNSLILAATHCGGDNQVGPSAEVAKLLSDMVYVGTDEAKMAAAACLFAKQTLETSSDIIHRYVEVSLQFPASTQIVQKQWEAVMGHDAWSRLPNITAPTLALTGSEDVLIPPENTTILAERIPNARSVVIDGGGHQVFVEKPEHCNQAIMKFLEDISR